MDATAYLRGLDRVVVLEAAADLRRYLTFCSDPVKRALVFSLVDALEANQLARWPADVGLAARGGPAPAALMAVHRRDAQLRRAASGGVYAGLSPDAAARRLLGDLAEFRRAGFPRYRAACRLPAVDPEAALYGLVAGEAAGEWRIPRQGQLAAILAERA